MPGCASMPSVEVAASPGFALRVTVTNRHYLYARIATTRSVTRLQKDPEDQERCYCPIDGPRTISRPGKLGCPASTDDAAAIPLLNPLV
jgi:hypothetical protein